MIQKIQSESLKQELNKTKYEFVLLPELEIQEELAKYLKHGKNRHYYRNRLTLQLH